MSKIDAIILAGAPAGEDLNPTDPSKSRAMVDICGKSMLGWIVDALKASPSIGKIAAVGDVVADGLDMVIKPGDSLVSNIKLGIDALKSEGSVLIVSSDIPLITPEGIEDFLERAVRLNVDFAFPVLPKAHCIKRYPELRRTYLKTGDGVFTGGNLMLASRHFFEHSWDAIAGAYAARKHVIDLARMIGLGVLLRVIIAQMIPQVLRISMLEKAVSRMLDAKVAAVVSAYPEIGEDVDKPSDLEVVRRILGS
ncbi:NTP transferase domain-containing protein [bacterium]|nr:NTP transferase domain-containing protein [bacterium]